jgi:hypothetical protein
MTSQIIQSHHNGAPRSLVVTIDEPSKKKSIQFLEEFSPERPLPYLCKTLRNSATMLMLGSFGLFRRKRSTPSRKSSK